MIKTPAQTPDNLGLVPEQAVGGARVHCCMLARALVYTCVYFFDALISHGRVKKIYSVCLSPIKQTSYTC